MAPSRDKLTLTLKRHALKLGFDDVGITTAEPAARDDEAYHRWLDAEMNGGMEWMNNGEVRRAWPGRILPDCKSVIVVAKNIHLPQPTEFEKHEGRVAQYAQGRDYHRILSKDLKKYAKFIREIGEQHGMEAETKWNLDTGHVLERAFAARAGVGFQGKNTMLISKFHGSHLLLAEIFTTLDLTPDEPEVPHCGTCTACLDACPTDAFPEPYVLDARKCISYLTIEHRGKLPKEIETNGWIFGCDICQEVCPWNRFAKPRTDHRFADEPVPPTLDIRKMAQLNDMDFESQFYATPIWRAHPEGLRRNAQAIARERSGENQITGS